jgi:hypothetical protein
VLNVIMWGLRVGKNKKKPSKPRNELFEILARVKPEKHKSDKRETGKRRKDKEREEILSEV